MRGLGFGMAGGLAALLLTSCGTSSVTLIQPFQGGGSLSVVVVGDSDAVSALKPKMQQAFGTPPGGVVQVLDGDQHTGNQICSYSVSNNSHNYTITVYGTAQFNPSEYSGACSSASPQLFLAQAS
jgi:hypothetical protein